MSRAILIIGESGAGKTTSLRNLDPATTYYFDADRKGGLNWKGAKKQYVAGKNYMNTSDAKTIYQTICLLNDNPNIKTVIIDTLNGIMIDDEMRRSKEKGYDKWVDLAASVYALVSNGGSFRDDMTIVFIGHTQTERDETGYTFTRLKTNGQKLNKICLESKFNTVLLCRQVDDKYIFETNANNTTSKSPQGALPAVMPNDLAEVIRLLDAYEYGEEN